MTRLYIDLELACGADLRLSEDAAHHVRKVLRLKRGDPVEVFNGRVCCSAELTLVARDGVEIRVGEQILEATPPPLAITLVQSISKGERMDFCLQKAVELGVYEIVPVTSSRTVVRLDGDRLQRRVAHWRGVIRHAAEQSGRIGLPSIRAVRSLADWLTTDVQKPCWLLNPEAPHSLASQPDPGAQATIIAGPEGGFAAEEVAHMREHGVRPVHLGPRILRTETAAIAALSVCQSLWGDLK